MKPFVVSLSNHAFRGKRDILKLKIIAKSVVRQAHHERVCRANRPNNLEFCTTGLQRHPTRPQ